MHPCTNTDDYAIFSNQQSWLDNFEKAYTKTGTILNNEGRLERWGGQDIIHLDDGSVQLSQKHDVLSAIADMPGITDMRTVDSPMESN